MVALIILHARISVYSLALICGTAAPSGCAGRPEIRCLLSSYTFGYRPIVHSLNRVCARSRKVAGRSGKLARSILFAGMSLSQSCLFSVSRRSNHERFAGEGGKPGSHLLSPRVEGLVQRIPWVRGGCPARIRHALCSIRLSPGVYFGRMAQDRLRVSDDIELASSLTHGSGDRKE
jgi:hypothetical protein